MTLLVVHLALVFVLIICWLTITGRVAEWQWGDWGKSRWAPFFLGGPFEELPDLKRFHFWLGWIGVCCTLGAYTFLMYGYFARR